MPSGRAQGTGAGPVVTYPRLPDIVKDYRGGVCREGWFGCVVGGRFEVRGVDRKNGGLVCGGGSLQDISVCASLVQA